MNLSAPHGIINAAAMVCAIQPRDTGKGCFPMRLQSNTSPRSLLPRDFWSKVDKSGDCWVWQGTTSGVTGYGIIYKKRKNWLVHRAVYESTIGPIPKGMTIDHLCRNRLCVNPGHMEVVTPIENVMRGEGPTAQNARKTHCIHGHPFDVENTQVRKEGWRACAVCRERVSRSRSKTRRTVALKGGDAE